MRLLIYCIYTIEKQKLQHSYILEMPTIFYKFSLIHIFHNMHVQVYICIHIYEYVYIHIFYTYHKGIYDFSLYIKNYAYTQTEITDPKFHSEFNHTKNILNYLYTECMSF